MVLCREGDEDPIAELDEMAKNNVRVWVFSPMNHIMEPVCPHATSRIDPIADLLYTCGSLDTSINAKHINAEVFYQLLQMHNQLVRRSNDMLSMLTAIYDVNPHYRTLSCLLGRQR